MKYSNVQLELKFCYKGISYSKDSNDFIVINKHMWNSKIETITSIVKDFIDTFVIVEGYWEKYLYLARIE